MTRARMRHFNITHTRLLTAGIAVIALGSVLLWVYYAKASQLAQSTGKPITTTAQAVSDIRQVKSDLDNLNVNVQLDTSEIDSVLNNQ